MKEIHREWLGLVGSALAVAAAAALVLLAFVLILKRSVS